MAFPVTPLRLSATAAGRGIMTGPDGQIVDAAVLRGACEILVRAGLARRLAQGDNAP